MCGIEAARLNLEDKGERVPSRSQAKKTAFTDLLIKEEESVVGQYAALSTCPTRLGANIEGPRR